MDNGAQVAFGVAYRVADSEISSSLSVLWITTHPSTVSTVVAGGVAGQPKCKKVRWQSGGPPS